MDQSSFDRIARLLVGATTRRAGIGALVAAAASAALARDIAARARHVTPEGPCGDGSMRDNACTRHSQCCTGVCKTPAGKKNKGDKGRCRCLQRGKACSDDRNCCNTLTCIDGACGSVVPDVCLVCASGCPYATVQAAILGVPADTTIFIDEGDYAEDLIVSANTTLKACNGAAVTLRNATADTRAIAFDPLASPTPTLTINSITITSNPLGTHDGGISGIGNLTLNGTATVTDCTAASGGGIDLGGNSTACVLTMNDSSTVRNCTADSYGGGITLEDGGSLVMNDTSSVTGNNMGVSGYGAGIAARGTATVVMNDSSSVTGNTCLSGGGGLWIDAQLPNPADVVFAMNGSAAIRGNTGFDGGGVYINSANTMVMNDSSIVENNACTGGNSNGGGIFTSGNATMNGASQVKGNSSAGDSGGLYIGAALLAMSGTASITGNTAAGKGGGVYLDASGMIASASNRVSGNTAGVNPGGGGVRIPGSQTYTVPGGVVVQNTPDNTCTGC